MILCKIQSAGNDKKKRGNKKSHAEEKAGVRDGVRKTIFWLGPTCTLAHLKFILGKHQPCLAISDSKEIRKERWDGNCSLGSF